MQSILRRKPHQSTMRSHAVFRCWGNYINHSHLDRVSEADTTAPPAVRRTCFSPWSRNLCLEIYCSDYDKSMTAARLGPCANPCSETLRPATLRKLSRLQLTSASDKCEKLITTFSGNMTGESAAKTFSPYSSTKTAAPSYRFLTRRSLRR